MGIFERIRKKILSKNENSKAYKLDKARSFDNKKVKYVAERTEKGEVVLGKEGYINVIGEMLTVCCEAEVVFESEAAELFCGELLSLGGVIFTGYDRIAERERTVVCYYEYYRKT